MHANVIIFKMLLNFLQTQSLQLTVKCLHFSCDWLILETRIICFLFLSKEAETGEKTAV